MSPEKALKMLNEGKIEELKELLRSEISSKGLNTSEKARLQAGKRFFKFSPNYLADMCKMPCVLQDEGENRMFYLNGHALISSKEIFDIPTIDPAKYLKGAYDFFKELDTKTGRKIDINKAIAELKVRGYSRKISEVRPSAGEYPYTFEYDGAYYNAGLLEIAYSIIASDEIPTVYHTPGQARMPIFIKNSIGTAMILPFQTLDNVKNTINLEEDTYCEKI